MTTNFDCSSLPSVVLDRVSESLREAASGEPAAMIKDALFEQAFHFECAANAAAAAESKEKKRNV